MTEPLLPDLPAELAALIQSLYSEPELARRALLAPWPLLGFRSAYEERSLWSSGKDGTGTAATGPKRRDAFERNLRQEGEPFRREDQPYFVTPYTRGTLRSPYPEMSDPEFWLYVTLYGSETAARQTLEGKLVPSLGWKTTLEYLRKACRPGLWDSLRQRLGGRKEADPHLTAWSAQTDLLYPSYS